MKIIGHIETLSMLCQSTGKWGLYLNLPTPENHDFNEVLKAVPWLSLTENFQAIIDGCAFVICDSEEECERLFWQVVGDDGPTKTNPYSGPYRAYALTCGPDGQWSNENT